MNRLLARRPGLLVLVDPSRTDAAEATRLAHEAQAAGAAGLMIGSICIVELPSRREVDAWLAAEPYVTGKVWETVEVAPCRVGPSFAK